MRAKKQPASRKDEKQEAAPSALPTKGMASAVTRAGLEQLRRDGPLVNYRGGCWAKPDAALGQDGRPVTHIKGFIIKLLVDRGVAEFTKFKKTRGGQIACEVKARG